jgi:hypothetical protein
MHFNLIDNFLKIHLRPFIIFQNNSKNCNKYKMKQNLKHVSNLDLKLLDMKFLTVDNS